MIKDLLMEFIFLSDKMRCGYKNSLGIPCQSWEQAFAGISQSIPDFFREIYGSFAGTHRAIKEQRLMDFIPGYRLIHIQELKDEYNTLLHIRESETIHENQVKEAIPFLADYASCYICYVKKPDNTESIFSYSPDEGFVEMHSSLEKFFDSIIAFYKEGVYFLDSDGFLDYDFEREGIVGEKYNPGIRYWSE